MPFGLNSRQQNAWMQFGGGDKLMAELFDQYKVIALAGGNTGTQMGGWFRNPIKGLADQRPENAHPRHWRRADGKLGAVPQTLAGGDIYPALEKAPSTPPNGWGRTMMKSWASSRSPKLLLSGLWEPGPQITFMINKEHWAKLPKAYQAALKAAAAEANVTMQAEYDHKTRWRWAVCSNRASSCKPIRRT